MKNILVPVGSTENGINNLKYAINFASISGGTVYLINVKNYINIASLRWYSGKYIDTVDNQTEFRGSWEFHDNINPLYQYLQNNRISNFFKNKIKHQNDLITSWENWWGDDNSIWSQ